jgi:UDP-N-acetylglucosamine acyltransferase
MARVHPTAIVSPDAELGDDVEIGPYAIIGDNVTIGDHTWIDAHVKVDRYTKIGEDCRIYFGAVIGHSSVDLKYRGGECWTIIGDRDVLREYVTVSSSSFEGKATILGNDNLLMHWTNIAHDCVLGDHLIMANFATLGGHVEMEGNARIGAHAAFHQYVRVGRGAMAGACSKFVQDLPPYMVADGHPAEIRSLNLLGRDTAQNHPMRDVPEHSVQLLKEAYRLLFRANLNTSQAIARIRAELPFDEHVLHLVEFIESSKRGICR